jgi:hypothetical protein
LRLPPDVLPAGREEIRFENTLIDEDGNKVKLKEGAQVEVTVEADPESTLPKAEDQATEKILEQLPEDKQR